MQSPNPHEAARAQEEAERLMAKNGWRYSDFEKDATVEVPVSPNLVDTQLARPVGISRRVQTAINRRDQLLYIGKKSNAESARDCYLHLINECENAWKRGCGPTDPGAATWRRYFWGGFIHSVVDRLKKAETEVWTPPPEVRVEEDSPVHVVEKLGALAREEPKRDEVAEFRDKLQDPHSFRLFCQQAYDAGVAFGRQVAIPTNDTTTKDVRRMLDAKESSA